MGHCNVNLVCRPRCQRRCARCPTHAFSPHCLRVLWPLTTAASWFKAPSERMLGSISDLLCLTAVFVALKLDGVVGYSWKVRVRGMHAVARSTPCWP